MITYILIYTLHVADFGLCRSENSSCLPLGNYNQKEQQRNHLHTIAVEILVRLDIMTLLVTAGSSRSLGLLKVIIAISIVLVVLHYSV